MPSKTQKAIAAFNDPENDLSQNEVARRHGISKGALSRALKRLRETKKHRCECCGQWIAPAFRGIKK